MTIQVLRFVSPHPWGSHAAEGFRKRASLDRIVTSLFDDVSDTSKKRSTFSAGSLVLWTPVYIGPSGQLKHTKPVSRTGGWSEGWLASRSPPHRSTNGSSGLEIDITSLILDNESFTEPIEVLYDNRFVLSFDPQAIPDKVFERLRAPPVGHRLVVAPTKEYFLPRLIFRVSNGNTVQDISVSGPDLGAGSATAGSGHSFGVDWASWRLARAFE